MDKLKTFEEFNLNEGKLKDVKNVGNMLVYNGEEFAAYNYPKRYVGKRNYKYRVLAKEGEKVKPVSFGKRDDDKKVYTKFNRKYWEMNWK